MSAFLRKYNTLTVTGTTAIRIPMIKRAVVDFAVGADWTPAPGDVKIAIDGAAAANVTNLPTAVAMGNTAYWEFVLTAAELTCKSAVVTIGDSATKVVEDNAFIVETFGNASAMYQADLSAANLPANVTQLLGTAWLTPGTAGTPDVNAKLWNGLTTVALPLVPTTAGRTLDVSAGGEAGVDWANVGSPTTSLALTGTTIATTQKVDIETIKTQAVATTGAGTITVPAAATLASTTNITGGTITTVTNLTNAATAGDLTAAMIASVTTAATAATPTAAAVTGAVGSVTGNVGGNVAGSVGSVTAAVAITSNIKQNQALAKFEFLMTDSTNHAPATGLTVTVTRSIDGGTFAAGTLSAVTEVGNGVYYVDFGAGDLNGKVITLQATAAASDTTFERIVTQV